MAMACTRQGSTLQQALPRLTHASRGPGVTTLSQRPQSTKNEVHEKGSCNGQWLRLNPWKRARCAQGP